ncbi:hypothetical protein CHCC14821_3632 [Bacillus paralicheniformis]|nr:hypothetical protein CHCC14821_3632 [Bacillus paralicheniformis]
MNETSLFLHPEISNRNDSYLKVCLSFFKHDKKRMMPKRSRALFSFSAMLVYNTYASGCCNHHHQSALKRQEEFS